MSHQPPTERPDSASQPARGRAMGDLLALKRAHTPIVMVTVFDAPSARLAEEAGVDVLLVGDSAAMTVLGYDSTLPVTIDEMITLTRAARRGAPAARIVADMPFGSYQASDESAVQSAVRFVQECGADAVKVEGAGPMLRRVSAIVDAGIPVMGHIGLTPQSIKRIGGYKVQGRTADAARHLSEQAHGLERAGATSIVLEAIPARVSAHITQKLGIPTIGIGAGPHCDGQVLVWHDLLGLTSGRVARFVKQYESLGERTVAALRTYADEVRAGRFPGAAHAYTMSDGERDRFEAALLDHVERIRS